MDELIKQMADKGLVSFVTCGKSQAVFNFIKVMATTRPYTWNDFITEEN